MMIKACIFLQKYRTSQEILKKNGILDWSEVGYNEGSITFTDEAKKIKEISLKAK